MKALKLPPFNEEKDDHTALDVLEVQIDKIPK